MHGYSGIPWLIVTVVVQFAVFVLVMKEMKTADSANKNSTNLKLISTSHTQTLLNAYIQVEFCLPRSTLGTWVLQLPILLQSQVP